MLNIFSPQSPPKTADVTSTQIIPVGAVDQMYQQPLEKTDSERDLCRYSRSTGWAVMHGSRGCLLPASPVCYPATVVEPVLLMIFCCWCTWKGHKTNVPGQTRRSSEWFNKHFGGAVSDCAYEGLTANFWQFVLFLQMPDSSIPLLMHYRKGGNAVGFSRQDLNGLRQNEISWMRENKGHMGSQAFAKIFEAMPLPVICTQPLFHSSLCAFQHCAAVTHHPNRAGHDKALNDASPKQEILCQEQRLLLDRQGSAQGEKKKGYI